MAKLSLLFPLLLLLLVTFASSSLSLHSDLPLSAYGLPLSSNSRCSFGECSEEENELEDPTTRRFLAGSSGYISYGALRRDNVPCNRRGASYYNCRPGAQANPYRRGCSAITRCRG